MKKKSIGVLSLILIWLFINSNIYSQVTGPVDIRYAEQVITVGGSDADVSGFTSEAIQIALDAIKTRGGGIVKLNPGVYKIIGPIRLSDKCSLIGSGKKTILQKCDGFRTSFIADVDWEMIKAVVKDVSGFKKGMGIQIYDDTYIGWQATTAVITDIKDNVIYFDKPANYNYKSTLNGAISNGCSIIEAVGVNNIKIADLVIEGNKNSNDYIEGCQGGGIFMHRIKNCLVENVKVNEFNGDSFCWAVDEYVTVKDCEASNGNGHGFHPGAGSDHSIVENCISHNNSQEGILLCWRVQNGIFRNNTIYANSDNGISIGHGDTDNFFENNQIYENGSHGVLFRDETEQNSGHRNNFSNNIIENNGVRRESSGFYIGGETHDINITNNIIRSTGKGNQTKAIFVNKKSSRITVSDNKISGLKEIVHEK